jgi:hypothetical protein
MMKLKRLILVGFFVMFGNGVAPLWSQNNMTLYFIKGAEKSTVLSSLSKITFSGTNMVMNYSNGSVDAIDLLSVRKIGFAILNGVESQKTTGDLLMAYPSPAVAQLSLVNIPFGARFAILFRLDGTVISKIQLSSSSQDIDVRSLPSGFYLLRINNSTVKFAKK